MVNNQLLNSGIALNNVPARRKLHEINTEITSLVIGLGFAVFLVFAWGIGNASAQQTREITGTVVDSTDRTPLPGVNIAVEGTTIGTSTNAQGRYALDVPPDAEILVFSFVGYAPKREPIGSRSRIDVALVSDVQLLEDVVVVGYGTQRREDATGSVLAVTEDDFNVGVITSPEQLLQGRAAGIQITPSSGEPGAGVNIRIRGTSSLRSGNDPLFVVDGVPLNGEATTPGGGDFGAGTQSSRNPLSFINPEDIASISVLKDASAAAIYGARASNGVVLITTKRGQAGGTSLTVSASTSISTLREKLDLLEADEYIAAAEAAGADPAVVGFGGATDWQDQVFRTALTQDYNVSYGGGAENTTYRLSLGYMDQKGIIENSALERLTGRLSATHAMLDNKLQFNFNLITTRLNDSYAPVTDNAGFEGDLLGAALQANPTRSPFNDNGGYSQSADWRNPAAMLAYIDDDANTTRLLANLGATYDFTNWLSYNLNLAYDNSDAVRRTAIDPLLWFPSLGYDPAQGRSNGRAVIDNRYLTSSLMEHTINMQRPLLENGTFNLLAGFSYQRFENRGDWLQAEYFITNQIPLVDNLGGVDNSGANKAFTGASDRSVEELQSFFGRVNYNYDDRYLLTANFRADGSTKFGENNKYGYFPSLAAAWRLSEEDFFSGLSSTFSDLKLRAGWGITGNQEYPGGASLAIFRANADGSLTQVNNPNPDIQWEKTTQWNLGVDFEVLEGRLAGSVDYFHKSTTDMLFRRDYAQPAAVEYQWVNLDGDIVNSGLEVALDAFVVSSEDFSWQVMYNMSFLHNEVTKLGTYVNTGEIHGQGLTGAYAQRIAEGQPLYAFYMREFAGYDENGLAQYANEGALDFVGDPLPDYTLGLTNNLQYGRFDMSIFLNGSFGFQVYNNTANAIFLKGNLRNGRNITREVATGPESANNFGEVSTRFLENGDFLRLSNLSIGYNVNVTNLDPIQRLRLSVTGQNLFVITNYSGFDPEVNTNKAIDDVPSLGIDYTAYPRARTVTFNVQLNL